MPSACCSFACISGGRSAADCTGWPFTMIEVLAKVWAPAGSAPVSNRSGMPFLSASGSVAASCWRTSAGTSSQRE